jgi:hypothetical protein
MINNCGIPQIVRKAPKNVFTNRFQKVLDFWRQNHLDFSDCNQVGLDFWRQNGVLLAT